jgi:hypothetical protein
MIFSHSHVIIVVSFLLLLTGELLVPVRAEEVVRIAFVFAGGVRSFILPPLYESIKHNVINAFCPPDSCIPDVFVRMSISDNKHDSNLAKWGKAVNGTQEQLEKALVAVRRLLDNSQGKLRYTVVDIGSAQEAADMDEYTTGSFRQRFYRDLDSRRYSMYFNRWKAYEMALKEEQTSGYTYRWVVHARLDTIWGYPVRPYYMWNAGAMGMHVVI